MCVFVMHSQELLAAGADPNSIFLREERIKGSDGCCSCAISWEDDDVLGETFFGQKRRAPDA